MARVGSREFGPLVPPPPRAPLGMARWCPGCGHNFTAVYSAQIACSPTCRRVARELGLLPAVPIAAKELG